MGAAKSDALNFLHLLPSPLVTVCHGHSPPEHTQFIMWGTPT